MDSITQRFDDEDLIIPRELIRQLGVKPGDSVEIRPASETMPSLLADERTSRLELIRSLRATWTAEDEAAFERAREEMWGTWRSSDSS